MVKRLLIGLILVLGTLSTYAQGKFADNSPIATQDEVTVVEFYPNPAVDYLSVVLKNSSLQDVKLELFSILGNKLNLQAETMGDFRFRFNVQDLDPGYYLLVVRDDSSRFRQTYKFLKK